MKSIKNFLVRAWTSVIDILFPIKCLGCGLELEDLQPRERWICASCLAKIPIRRMQTCPVCEEFSDGGNTHVRCRKKTALDGLWVSAEYGNKLVSEAVKKLKFSFVKDISYPLSKIVERSVSEIEEFGDFHDILLADFSMSDDEEKFLQREKNKKTETVIIPVPLHRRRYNWRGFNQAELIADFIAKKYGIRMDPDILARTKNTKPQTKAGSALRRKINMKGAFICKVPNEIKGKNLIIIDDVSTTLATMDECAKTVKKAGAKKVWGLVVARR